MYYSECTWGSWLIRNRLIDSLFNSLVRLTSTKKQNIQSLVIVECFHVIRYSRYYFYLHLPDSQMPSMQSDMISRFSRAPLTFLIKNNSTDQYSRSVQVRKLNLGLGKHAYLQLERCALYGITASGLQLASMIADRVSSVQLKSDHGTSISLRCAQDWILSWWWNKEDTRNSHVPIVVFTIFAFFSWTILMSQGASYLT